ncbi:MAG: ABC transporter permease [Saccharofermentanales bacterium]|jgi:peptide/nickel transport system permease protein|nr:ABC transporter permease [Bacillota bacterium]
MSNLDKKKDSPDLLGKETSDREREELKQAAEAVTQVTDDELALDDERRIKVLSPSALVFRRFIRNRLAIVGVVILLFMFLFSFLGAELSPYGYQELFYTTEERLQDFGGIQKNEDLRFLIRENAEYSSGARAYLLKAIGEGKRSYEYSGKVYEIESLSDRVYLIHSASEVASVMQLGKKLMFTAHEEVPAGLEEAAIKAIGQGQSEIDLAGQIYAIESSGREYTIYSTLPIALGSYNVVNFDNPESKNSFDFQLAIEQAVLAGAGKYMVEAEGKNYEVEVDEEGQAEIRLDNTLYATLSSHMVNALNQNLHLPIGFVAETLNAIENKSNTFTYTLNGEEREFVLEIRYERWVIREMDSVTVYNIRSAPSKEHWLGTDATGMDMFTRLMYGGRVSLLVGFVVVFIAMFIGVILGGLAGYFGGVVDMVIMRLVEIFFCIPTLPILIILGAIMDELKLGGSSRLIYMMVVLGVLSWAGIARMVRGQILSLREQEFMVAAEATGLSVNRRIYRHLIPNVIPLLIVTATMSLGSTIITESTLSFLGLGVKYPTATWGNIINAVSTSYDMNNFPWLWMPAGFCIVITVLAFNFVGDGLRDAFDPRMKR